jgi:hypothetical protein
MSEVMVWALQQARYETVAAAKAGRLWSRWAGQNAVASILLDMDDAGGWTGWQVCQPSSRKVLASTARRSSW